MKRTRTLLLAAVVAAGLLTAAAPAAHASMTNPFSGYATTATRSSFALPTQWMLPRPGGLPSATSSVCGTSSGRDGQGGTAGTANVVCLGAGLVFIGPSTGQIATVIGPTIISPGFVGNVVVSAGNGSIGGTVGG
jgi:hypothetical protein